MELNRCVRRLLAVGLLLGGVASAAAAESSAENDWKFGAEIYLWGAAINATTATGGDVKVSFNDLLRNLDMAFMGAIGARNGKWLLAADVIYLNVSQDNVGLIPLPSGGLSTTTDVKVKGWVVTPLVGYNLIDMEAGTLDVVAGARYLYLSSSLNLTATNSAGTLYARLADSANIWNGVVGARGQVNLAPNWFLPYYADIGAGDSKLTWELFAGIGYKFKHLDAILGYRYLDFKFKDDSPVFDDLNFSGPILGVRFQF